MVFQVRPTPTFLYNSYEVYDVRGANTAMVPFSLDCMRPNFFAIDSRNGPLATESSSC